jgi:hypothetical protein
VTFSFDDFGLVEYVTQNGATNPSPMGWLMTSGFRSSECSNFEGRVI